MEAVAHSKFARYSYRKVGQVLGLIRGKSVTEAFGMLPWDAPSLLECPKPFVAEEGRRLWRQQGLPGVATDIVDGPVSPEFDRLGLGLFHVDNYQF
jgi:hypothetical protein